MSRISDFIKGIISLALIVGLLAGVPALLIIIVGFPLPTEVPSFDLMRAHVEDGNIPDVFVVKTLAMVVWIVWMQLAVAVLAEVFALLRGRVAGRAPVLPGIQLFAGKLVGSTVLIISALTPARSAAAVPIVPLDMAQNVSFQALTAEPAFQSRNDFAGPAGMALASTADGSLGVATTHPAGQYTTETGDNWWDMAERLLGDGMRWSELRELNHGRTMDNGELISEQTETVAGGWRLDVPADAAADLLSPASLDSPVSSDIAAPSETVVPSETAIPSDSTATSVDEEAASVAAAIKPDTLSYEGPTGAVDAGSSVPYQVVTGDNLWTIAERHLGDPFRWPEIFENSSQLEQSFGRTISDPNLIWPDSILLLPSDAADVPTADPQLVLDVIGPAVEGQSLEEIATEIQPEDLRGVTAAAKEAAVESGLESEAIDNQVTVAAPPPDGFDGPINPDGSDGPADSADSESGASNDPIDLAVAASPGEPVGAADGAPTLADRVASPAGLAFGAGGLLVASGLLGLLQRTRKLRLSEAGERSKPAPPPLELVDIETVLRGSADTPQAQSVYNAIQSLAHRTVVVGEPVATPEVIRISRDRIEVVQRGADPDLPAPWLAGRSPALEFLADRSLAVLPAERFPEDLDQAEPVDTAAPACVTIGGGLVLNLESVGLLGIGGPPALSAGLIRSMVHELATGPARRAIDIRVSNSLPGAALHQHVRCGPLDHLADELESWLEDVELKSTAAGGLNAYGLRAAGMADSVPKTIVVFAEAADAVHLEPIVERARRRSLPLAVVFSGDEIDPEMACEITIKLDADTLKLEPHGFTAAMQSLDVDVLLGAEELIKHAGEAAMVPRDDEQSTILGGLDHNTDPAQVSTEETPEREIVTELPAEEHEVTDQAEDADTGILVRVLGPVEFEGAPAELTEPERSLLAFLALVGPSTEQQIRSAVWPTNTIDDAGFAETIDRLRAALGHQFPDLGDDRYRLRSVITDLGSARRWIAQAKSMSDERARSLLQLALADVRGEPFSGITERYWQWIADHKLALSTQASAMLIDACFDLCDNAYAADDIHMAKWACEVGSLIDPLHETVVTRRVQLLQILNQPSEANQVLEDWEALYEATASRPAPRGARMALQPSLEEAPYVG